MPLLPQDTDLEMQKGAPLSLPAKPAAPASPSFLDTAAAAERTSNLAGTLYDYISQPPPDAKAVPGFDPLTSIPKGYESQASAFVGATSPQEMQWRKEKVDRENADRKTIAAAGWPGVATTMAAGLTDPLTIASMALPLGGETRLAQAGRFALAAGATTAAQEGAMQGMELTRTKGESALNIAASTVVGGILGAAISPHVSKSIFDRLGADLQPERTPGTGSLWSGSEKVLGPIDGIQRIIPEESVKVPAAHPASEPAPIKAPEPVEGEMAKEGGAHDHGNGTSTVKVGDTEVRVPSEQAEKIGAEAAQAQQLKLPEVPQAITEIPEESGFKVNPTDEQSFGAAGVSGPTMRGETIARGAQTLAEGPLGQVSPGARLMASPSLQSRRLIQELANIPETTTKNHEGIATASPIERELWKQKGVHWQGMLARGKAFKAYRERIAGTGEQPLSRKEFGEEVAKAMRRGDTHQIPEVAKAAKDTRRIVFEPLKVRAQKVGALPENVRAKGAESYLMRQYDGQKIRGNLSDWMDRLTRGFMGQGVDVAEARDIAHSVTRNVLGSERGTMDWKTLESVPGSGQLKERTLDLPDTLLEPYLNNNIDSLSDSYLRSLAPEVEMRERFGSIDMADQLADMKDDYARMIERETDDGKKQDLYKRMEADVRDLAAVRDRLYGIYGQPKDPGSFAVRAGRILRSVNALRLLGAATLAHFPDMANVMMRYGLPQTFSAIGKVLTSPEAFNLTRSQAKRMGAGLDMSMNATASMLGDYSNHSDWLPQQIANRMSKAFTITTGETPLITAVQQLTSTMAQDELIRTAGKVAAGTAVNKNLLARMAAAGIDQNMLTRIAAQHEEFGAKVNGLNFGMSDQWTDKEAASVFESAVLRDAHSVTLHPGVGDTPLFMSTEWGKTLRQFTTFGYAAQRSVVNPLMQGLAHGDPRAAQAFLALTAMGTLSYVSKQTAAGQPIEPWDSPKFALEVLDKSNLMGWTSDYVFPSLWMMGMKNLSRWSDRDPVETIGGPTAGTLASLYSKQLPAKFLADTENGEKGVSRADLHFMRRLAPGQNLWYARNGINALEDAVGDSFELPGKSNADRFAENVQ
jgi:hypothetical protein